ncbi:uncharacterized protein LOC102607217 isoform X5 [Citrus sinensis]|uniref:uncharacterized protein LOC102607217 isoform X5 n=1 Tax=Citrus sinensis TaxID=2711 RepID=UPI002278EF33|nr:uncharacterized protein LOC102607217 isoform X5 [Citrus sinensis]
MRMRNRDRFAMEHSGTPSDSSSHELGEIEVLYFNVVDKEKLKELSVKKYSDVQISVPQPNMQQPRASDEGNSSSNQENMQLIEANSSQTMANKDAGGPEDSDKEKSNSLANNQKEETFANATVNLEQAATASSSNEKAMTKVGYDLRPRHKGRAIKIKSLDCVRNDDNNLRSEANEDGDILITDMLNEEKKRKLKANLEKKSTNTKKP